MRMARDASPDGNGEHVSGQQSPRVEAQPCPVRSGADLNLAAVAHDLQPAGKRVTEVEALDDP
jgi:hypothetical protein